MRKVLAVMLVLCVLLYGIASASEDDDFDSFPATGRCTGENVRYRSSPTTASNENILGTLGFDDEVRVLGSSWKNGELWYKIRNPKNRKKTVWVYGEYIVPDHPNGDY